MAKPTVTRTLGPIHFEDLDPKRFEDLVRELVYDFKDWQTLESVGRSGTDDGFDIRAREKISTDPELLDEDEVEIKTPHPMDGNIWMIQGKREKEIGPKRVKEILKDIDSKNPPYGYILAASANFSITSQDIFREELRKKGVMEFYIWDKGYLEGLLYLPKNDRILFAFFGISLSSRKRSRTTEIRQVVLNKNRVQASLKKNDKVLLRDSGDTKYPYTGSYKDFKTNPRWKAYFVEETHPLGLVLNHREFFAYVNIEKKEFDFTDAVNRLSSPTETSFEEQQKQREKEDKISAFFDTLPNRRKATYFSQGLVLFSKMLVIDKEGDDWHDFPHIFLDFSEPNIPFEGFFIYIKQGKYPDKHSNQIWLDGYKRVKIFPDTFPKPSEKKKTPRAKTILINEDLFRSIDEGNDLVKTLFDIENKLSFIKIGEVYPVSDGISDKTIYIKITHSEKISVKDFQDQSVINVPWIIERQTGKKLDSGEIITIYEYKQVYDFNLNIKPKNGPNHKD